MESVLQTLLDAVLFVAFIGCIFAYFWSEHQGIKKAIGAASIFLLIGLAAALSAVIVPAGSVGVVTAFGAVQNDTLQPGIHFRAPFVNNVHMITTRVQPHEFKELEASSAENLSLPVSGTMNYHIDGAYASLLYQTVGDDFATKVIDPAFADYIKQVIPNYSADSDAANFVLAKRDEIRQLTKEQLNLNLARYHIIVDDIYLVNIGYPPEFEAAITAKQVAQQQVQTEKQVTQQRIQQAEQAKQQAIGVANALRETAKGQAEANDLITKSLTPELIQYTLIQKLAPTIQTMILPAGQQFILDPKALLVEPK